MFTDLVYIGRFQPFHNEHLRVIEQALTKCDHLVLVIGSCNVARSTKNPFTAEEREAMIRASVSNPEAISFVYSNDYPYDWQRWEDEIVDAVQEAVLDNLNGGLPVRLHGLDQCNIGLLCPRKDAETGEYLDLFQCWEHINVEVENPINATDIRKAYLGDVYSDSYEGYDEYLDSVVPVAVAQYMNNFEATVAFKTLYEEYAYIQRYKESWADAPFPPMFITVDNVVIHRGKVLLIKRGGYPGNGLWALPGGFHEVGQTLRQSALRELREETTLDNVEIYLEDSRVFDNPSRSQLGAMVTHAYFYLIPDEVEVPLVSGQDDATHAEWVDLDYLDPRQMHDDHWHIINEVYW